MKLHLSCGGRKLPGFVNINNRSCVEPDEVMDVARLDYDDGSVDLIYASHVLEHFPRDETLKVLREWHRVLRPEGLLRVSVPDFARIADFYVFYGMTIWNLRGFLMGRQDWAWNTHYVVFDHEFLRWLLHDAGFYGVEEWDPDDVLPDGFVDYSRAEEYGEPWSLNLQARKVPSDGWGKR